MRDSEACSRFLDTVAFLAFLGVVFSVPHTFRGKLLLHSQPLGPSLVTKISVFFSYGYGSAYVLLKLYCGYYFLFIFFV